MEGLKNRLLSPKSDLIFKLIFGDQHNADILAAFLRAVLDIGRIRTATIVDPHLKQDIGSDKLGILDVKVHTRTVFPEVLSKHFKIRNPALRNTPG